MARFAGVTVKQSSMPGLRERKKARTRAAIQSAALRLFRERGYDDTTVEQVAEAAEVAPSTVFRYFPTKEDLVVSDDYDPFIVHALRAQPPELTPIQAVRRALQAALNELSPEELAGGRDRTILIFSVSALRGASMANLIRTKQELAEVVGERVGRDPGDPAVRAFTGAVVGVFLDFMLQWADDPNLDPPTALDRALAHLEAGLPL